MILNAATWFVDRQVLEGRADSIAIECGDRRLTYRDLQEQVNRAGSALRNELGVRPEERVLLLMLDGPEMIAAFFGAIKVGAVPVPLNTRWTAAGYEYVFRDSAARVIVVSGTLHAEAIKAVRACPSIRHVVVLGEDVSDAQAIRFEQLVAESSAVLEAEPTSCDAPA